MESDDKSQFFFSRNDGKVLGEIDREPIEFYKMYIKGKRILGEITGAVFVFNRIILERSSDDTVIRLTVHSFEDIFSLKDSS